METLQKYFFLALGAALVIWSFYAFLNSPAPAHYQNYRGSTSVRLDEENAKLFVGAVQIPIEVADTNEERARGLSGRSALKNGGGLFFIFDMPGSYSFWMKDMRFPIDIVWINENWEVVGVERGVAPGTFPQTFYPPSEILYVLELNAGEAAKLGIDAGSKVTRNR